MFTKDSRTENFLTQLGVAFTYSNDVKYSSLLLGWGERNLARPIPKREDAIVEYATLMDSGSPAPAPILCKTENGFDVLDGVQRIAAAELAGYSQISAYIIECDSQNLIASIKVLANARLQGRAEPAEWTRKRAVEVLVVERGMTAQEVAKLGGWRLQDIERIANNLEWNKSIREIGGPDELPDAVIDVVSKHTSQAEIRKFAPPISEFLRVIKSSSISAKDSEQFIEEFFKPISKPSNAFREYKDRVQKIKQDPEIVARLYGRRGFQIPVDVNLRRSLKAVHSIVDDIIRDGDSLSYVDEFFQLIKTLESKLHLIAKNHKKPVTADTPADMWVKHE